MKKAISILLLILASISFGQFVLSSVFASKQEPYVFQQEADQIASIEIVKMKQDSGGINTPVHVLLVLEENQYQEILDAIVAVPGGRTFGDYPTGLSVYYIRITYQDGAIEAIGDYAYVYYSADGKCRDGNYVFETEPFYEMLSSFLGRVALP